MPSDAKIRAMREALVTFGHLDGGELSEITVFRGYRRRDGGITQELWIESHYDDGDTSANNGANRYTAVITGVDTDRTVRGNGARTIEEALAIMHWHELDS
jgi:hypothetical protein